MAGWRNIRIDAGRMERWLAGWLKICVIWGLLLMSSTYACDNDNANGYNKMMTMLMMKMSQETEKEGESEKG